MSELAQKYLSKNIMRAAGFMHDKEDEGKDDFL